MSRVQIPNVLVLADPVNCKADQADYKGYPDWKVANSLQEKTKAG